MNRRPIGCAAVGAGLHLAVICDDGTAWLWAPEPAKTVKERDDRALDVMLHRPVQHTWVQYHTPIPGSYAHATYTEQPGGAEAARENDWIEGEREDYNQARQKIAEAGFMFDSESLAEQIAFILARVAPQAGHVEAP